MSINILWMYFHFLLLAKICKKFQWMYIKQDFWSDLQGFSAKNNIYFNRLQFWEISLHLKCRVDIYLSMHRCRHHFTLFLFK